VQYTLWPLREVWIKVGLEKLENHKGIAVKALLDSGAIGLFMDTKSAKEKGFKLKRLKNSLLVQNINGMVDVGGTITYQVGCNIFFKRHVERAQMDICNLEKTEVILDMPWLAVHNPEIDWKKDEVKITRYPLVCRKRKQEEKKKVVRKTEEEKTVEELVSKRLWKWKRVFGKAESERMPVQKIWDYVIELKEGFVPRKGKVYSLSREK